MWGGPHRLVQAADKKIHVFHLTAFSSPVLYGSFAIIMGYCKLLRNILLSGVAHYCFLSKGHRRIQVQLTSRNRVPAILYIICSVSIGYFCCWSQENEQLVFRLHLSQSFSDFWYAQFQKNGVTFLPHALKCLLIEFSCKKISFSKEVYYFCFWSNPLHEYPLHQELITWWR